MITESLFSVDSTTPDLAALQQLCTRHQARLLVVLGQDLGAIGATGRGMLEMQGMLGEVDIVVGGLASAFASNGGFVASRHPRFAVALRLGAGSGAAMPVLSPVQTAAATAAIEIVRSAEGRQRRMRLAENVLGLRAGMQKVGFRLMGQPSSVVPVVVGDMLLARRMTAALLEAGGIVNLVEFPEVARNTSRWPLQVMAEHDPQDIAEFVAAARFVRTRAGIAKPRTDRLPKRESKTAV